MTTTTGLSAYKKHFSLSLVTNVSFFLMDHSRPLFFILFFSWQLKNVRNKNCWWLDSNPGPLVSEATTQPSGPQPLPKLWLMLPFTQLPSVNVFTKFPIDYLLKQSPFRKQLYYVFLLLIGGRNNEYTNFTEVKCSVSLSDPEADVMSKFYRNIPTPCWNKNSDRMFQEHDYFCQLEYISLAKICLWHLLLELISYKFNSR